MSEEKTEVKRLKLFLLTEKLSLGHIYLHHSMRSLSKQKMDEK
ncbi:hypothetical protein [Macrococcoides caseolyticum]|mgnify:CR=1 FL=1|nr:hypothetical protein [Macrococcus caseolyticus]